MAIIFRKDIAQNKVLMAYNNNVVVFKSDTPAKQPMTAKVSGVGFSVVLYPHPDKSFYFNFKDYLSALINTTNFADRTDYELVSGESDSFTYDVAESCFYESIIDFKILFTDNTEESESRTIEVLAGVEQLEDWKRNQILFTEDTISILSPIADRSNNTTYVKYWSGYPFEFSFYNRAHPSDFRFRNNRSGIDYGFSSKSKVTALYLTDGRVDISVEDFVPLFDGINPMGFHIDGVDQNVSLLIEKVTGVCGVYMKFLNQYGRWNYWLFSKHHYRKRSTKYLTEIDNNFSNVEDTISQTLQFGKVGDEVLRCISERMNKMQKQVLEQIIDSPKILMFTGEPFSKSTKMDWIEVRLKTSSLDVNEPHKDIYSYVLEFDLPERFTQKL